MPDQDAFVLGRSNLNRFLFADIGVEGSGMPLSVISALARQGFDPWQEAGRLAKLPRTAATEGLARLIAALPASPWPLPDATAIAARLVALLPRQDARPLCPSAGQPQPGNPWLIVAVVTIALLTAVAAAVAPAPAPAPPTPPALLATVSPATVPPATVPTGD